jgi:hypothetical protein
MARLVPCRRREGRVVSAIGTACSRLNADLSCGFLERQFGGHFDGGLQASIDGTFVLEETVNPLGGLTVFGCGFQMQADVYAAYHQNPLLHFHFTGSLRHEPLIASRDLTRLQRASKGAGESTGRGGNHVI